MMDKLGQMLSKFAHYKVVSFKRGTYLFNPQITQRPAYIYFLKSGICSLQGETTEGETRIYLFQEAPRILGYIPFIRNIEDDYTKGYYLMSIQTRTDCVAYQVLAKDFMELYELDPEFREMIVGSVMTDYMKVLQNFHSQRNGSATNRICAMILELAEVNQGVMEIRDFMTYEDIANYLGVHVVTVGRIMSKLIQSGYVRKEKKHHLIIEKPVELRELMIHESDFVYY